MISKLNCKPTLNLDHQRTFKVSLLLVIALCCLLFALQCKGVKLHNCGRRNFLHIPNVGLTKAGINHVNKECDVRKCNVMVSCHDNSHIFRKRFLISLDEKMNIKDMKEHIEKIHGIPITFQELLYENKPLDDNITIEHLNKGKKIKLLNLCLTTILPHIFSEDDTEGENEHEEEGDESSSLALSERRKIKKLQNKLKYYGYLTLLKEYKKLLHKVEENNSLIRRHDIIESYKAFDIEFKKVLHNNNINFEKVLKEIDMLKNITKKKLLLRLQVDYPLMSSSLIMRIKQLVRFYYLGDINSVMKFSVFFYILYKYSDYSENVKTFFLYLSLLFLVAPCKPFYEILHFFFFSVPRGMLFSGFTNVLSASYQQILLCQ
ncbi:ubiquitin, putative [Plasmodium ovale]|uniref:Ubiquitin, putative n=1 Tax=Plasmodium ovale TaxID=36330 RepID=A0A1D3KY63_PLAOA|nr:ubiquitin, putative [Plasmodium ovale]